MKKPKVVNETISFRLPTALVAVLKKTARRRALEEDRDIAFTDLCREAIAKMYPTEAEVDIFDTKRQQQG